MLCRRGESGHNHSADYELMEEEEEEEVILGQRGRVEDEEGGKGDDRQVIND